MYTFEITSDWAYPRGAWMRLLCCPKDVKTCGSHVGAKRQLHWVE